MFTSDNGLTFYVGDMQAGDREATQDEINSKLMKEAYFDIEVAIYKLLDETALSFGFKSPYPMDRAAGYKGSAILKYATFATTLTDWRDLIFNYVEAQEQEILIGNRPMPTVDEMLAELALNFPTPIKP